MKCTRRDFLKLMGLAGAAAAVAPKALLAELPAAAAAEELATFTLGLFILDKLGRERPVGELREIRGPSSRELIDVTLLDDEYRSFAPMMRSSGELSASIVGVPAPELLEAFDKNEMMKMRMRFDDMAFDFSAYATSLETSAARDRMLETEIDLKLTGAVVAF